MVKIGTLALNDFPLLLAPMEEITDITFRKICKNYGADLVYTEFVASDALIRNVKNSVQKMTFSSEERPVGIQIFGNDENSMRKAAEIAAEQHPDLIDINWGCPVKKIVKKGAGSGMLQDPRKLVAITAAIVQATTLPVTVKTRLGWDESNKPIVALAEQLQDVGIKAITIHGRTRAQLYSGSADWSLIGKVKENSRMTIPVFGNGDIDSPNKALEMKKKYGVDGIMIGRAAIGNPFIFFEIKHFFEHGTIPPLPSLKERVELCKNHLTEAIRQKGERTSILEMRRQYAHYFKGINGIKPYRTRLMEVSSAEPIFDILNEIAIWLQ